MRPRLSNIQGLIVSGYTHPVARHLFLSFAWDANPAAFVGQLTPLITTAQDWVAKPPSILNLSLTYAGLEALGVSADVLDNFPDEFIHGPNVERLGDVGSSAPLTWWNSSFYQGQLHCILHLYGSDRPTLSIATEHMRRIAAAWGVRELFPLDPGQALDGQRLPAEKEHFGYRDGISQPTIDWDECGTMPNGSSFRQFLLGYANHDHPSSPNQPPARALVHDGSYLAFRVIYQDVAAFRCYLQDQSAHVARHYGLALNEAHELLAAKLVGRWPNGAPLVCAPDVPRDELATSNDFDYRDDPNGERCPLTAHIRVTNPRDMPLRAVESNVPRLIRRGMPYGPPLDSDVDDGQDRGLIGLYICASLARQFERVLMWINRADFSPAFGRGPHASLRRQDALIGARHVTGADPTLRLSQERPMTVPLRSFVRTRGMVYCLIPGMDALRALCA